MATIQFLNNNNLDSSQEHTIDFPSLADQSNFWANQVIGSPLSTSYSTSRLLANENIEVPIALEKLLSVNYLRYLQDSKWFYFFITDRIYVNENTTAIALDLDVMQTFLFDFEIEESFILREHQDRYVTKPTDSTKLTAIFNKEYENIETGENFIFRNDFKVKENYPDAIIPLTKDKAATLLWATIICKEKIGNESSGTTTIKGIPTNVYTYIAPIYFRPEGSAGIINLDINTTLSTGNAKVCLTRAEFEELTQDPKVISISLSKYAPFNYEAIAETGTQGTTYVIKSSLELLEYDIVLYKGSTGAMFKIRDYKMLDFPEYETELYNVFQDIQKTQLSINNDKNINFEPKLKTNQFSAFVLEYGETKLNLDFAAFDFQTKYIEQRPTFSIKGSQMFYILSYLSAEASPNYKLLLDTQNEMPLRTDAWLQYLSQNKNSLITGTKTQIATGLISTAITGVTGGDFATVSAVQSGVGVISSIANNIARIRDLKETPDQVSNPAGDISQSILESDMNLRFKLYEREKQFMNKAFGFFYHYGYRCNAFKKPDLKSRYYFNFVQTTGANLKTDISNNVSARIAAIFDRGITFWHWRDANFKGVLNYKYENVEMNLI